MNWRSLVTLVALVVLAATPLRAQCSTSGMSGAGTTRTCSFTVAAPNPTSYFNPMLLDLTVTAASSIGTMTTADVVAGRSSAKAMTLSVRGNRSWVVTASGPATWTASGAGARTNKPASDLRWSTTSTGSGTGLSVTPATVFSGDAGETVSRTLYWWTQLSWTGDPPGSYSIEVTLTLTAP